DPVEISGMHRSSMDIRHPDENGIVGSTSLAVGNLHGPLAAPGRNQARLKTGGRTLNQSLRIVSDPRSQDTVADLQEQFDLLTNIRDKVTEVHDAVNDIVKMRKALASRRDAVWVKLDTALEAVQKELVDLRFVG